MTALQTVLCLAALGLLLYFGLCAGLVQLFLGRKKDDPDAMLRTMEGTAMQPYLAEIREKREWFTRQPREPVTIESMDGLRLRGDFISRENPRGILVLCHGFHGSGYADFSCAMELYHQLGFQLLVIDQRAHLGSQGRYLTMGAKERYDVRDWCVYLLQRFGREVPVILDGMSMGAATVLLAAGVGLPENVCGIIADSAYTTPIEIFRSVMRTIHLPRLFLPGASLCCRLMAGFWPNDPSVPEALGQNRLPVLLIHGEGDTFVPAAMAQVNYDACNSDKRLVLVPGAAHGMSYLVDKARVTAALLDFLDRVCPWRQPLEK